MLISIHDSSLRRVAYMDNVVPLAMHYADDTWRRLLKEATSTFTFKVDMLGRDNEQYLTDDAYVSFKYNGKQYLFNVMTITPDSGSKSIIVYCENLSLELLNETKAPIDVTTSRNLLWYLNNDGLLNNAGITLGINEVSDKVAKIKLDSEQTGLARLTSIANNFDAEIEFVTELNGDGTLKSMTVNFFKKYDGVSQGIGTYRRDLILEYGRNVEGIKRTIDKTDLYNAITPNGKDGLNITSLEKEEYDENGNLEYYTKKGSPNIFAPQSKARYKAQLLNDTDGWLRRHYSADGTSNVNTLYSLALNELKKHAYPAITYEVTGFYDLDIGDTVRIVDHSFTPTLIIQARVAEQSICFSDPTKNKTTFGNILALESRVSQDLTGRLKELVDQVAPYRFEIVSDNGLTFKNSTGSTTLTARVFKGSNIDEVSVDSFEWLLDGVSFGGTAKSQLVNASKVTGTAVVRYNAKIGNTVIGGIEVTIQDISDGTNGISPIVTVNPDTSLTIVDAQGTSTTPVLKGDKGNPTGITKSATEPENKFDGMIWYVDSNVDVPSTNMEVGSSAQSNGQYTWNGTKWSLYMLRSINMMVDNGFITNAMIANAEIDNAKIKDATIESAKIKSINADKVNATSLETLSAKIGKIYNEFDNSSGGIDNKGTITIEDSVKVVYYLGNSSTTIDLVTSSSGQGLFTQYLPDKTDASKFKQSWYMPTGLYFTDSINNWTGQITAENVTLVPWTNLTYLSGYTTAENNPCQYRKIKNLDGSYTVQFRGQVKPVSGSFPGTNSESNFQIIANLPVDIRPSRHTFLSAIGDMMGTQTIRIGALSDGRIQVGVRGTASSYIGINSLIYTI